MQKITFNKIKKISGGYDTFDVFVSGLEKNSLNISVIEPSFMPATPKLDYLPDPILEKEKGPLIFQPVIKRQRSMSAIF